MVQLLSDFSLTLTLLTFTNRSITPEYLPHHLNYRQGHVKVAGHFKAYINPCLEAINSANIGFDIGPIRVGAECCADDMYVQTDSQSGLQAAFKIVSHYALRYRVMFNAEKTKIVVTGSIQDMDYYQGPDLGPYRVKP